MTPETSFGQAVASIMVTGLGLGITFPSFTIAVQNASPAGQLGAVTSASQFYRSIGGALGLAVLGSFMANRFAAGLQDSLPPAVRQALPADQLAQMEENPQALVNPEALAGLRAAFADRGPQGEAIVTQLIDALQETLASAISSVFVVVAVALAIAFVVTIFLREVPLQGRGRGRGPETRPRALATKALLADARLTDILSPSIIWQASPSGDHLRWLSLEERQYLRRSEAMGKTTLYSPSLATDEYPRRSLARNGSLSDQQLTLGFSGRPGPIESFFLSLRLQYRKQPPSARSSARRLYHVFETIFQFGLLVQMLSAVERPASPHCCHRGGSRTDPDHCTEYYYQKRSSTRRWLHLKSAKVLLA